MVRKSVTLKEVSLQSFKALVKNTLIIFFINCIKCLRNKETLHELFSLLEFSNDEQQSIEEMLENCCVDEKIQESLNLKF